nr:hypothetical protein [Nocardia cyriacigeorgica]
MSEAIGRVRPDLAGADPIVRRSDRADFQSNAALPLAKKSARNPLNWQSRWCGISTPRTSRSSIP